MTNRRRINQVLLLPPTMAAVASLLAVLPWALSQPSTGGPPHTGWTIGIVALVAYPITVVTQLMLMSWVARRAKRRSITLSATVRRSMLLLMPALLVVFAGAMAVALWLRYAQP